jgi:septal ring factor EnvC (AmiA/AmiB activator)
MSQSDYKDNAVYISHERTSSCWIIGVVLCCAILATFAGCQYLPQQAPVLRPAAPDVAGSAATRFEHSSPQGPSAVESAIELSQKYARASEEAALFKQRASQLEAENQKLSTDLAATRSQFQQAQKELNEANDLLVEMRVELNNWKNNILGFRSEMRAADKAQLEALLRILQMLGGETAAETTQLDQGQPDAVGSQVQTSG